MSDPTLETVTAYAYDEWQIAEGDSEMAGDTDDASYSTGQADAFRDMFIQLSKVANPAFDFAKFCAEQVLIDKDFRVNSGELD
jgi:hypothetical protein